MWMGRILGKYLFVGGIEDLSFFLDDAIVVVLFLSYINLYACIALSFSRSHNLPDGSGNRYCINLVSVAGKPE